MKKEGVSEVNSKKLHGLFELAWERKESPYVYPKPKKQIVIVSKYYKLLSALTDLAKKENAQLRHARPRTPDVVVFSAAVKIIDRHYLGAESWETYYEYLEQVNEDITSQFDEPVYEDTPLFIIDNDLAGSFNVFKEPQKVKGGVYYIEQNSVELIVSLTRKLLRKSTSGVCMVKAVNEIEMDYYKKPL